jgi:F0F1-type ATP synthase assembly protein I
MLDLYSKYIKNISIAFEICFSILLGAGCGYWLDDYFEINQFGIMIGFLVGVSVSIGILYKFSKEYLETFKTP